MRSQREKNERNTRAYRYGRKRSGLAALLGYDLITDILDPDESLEKNRDQGYADQLKYGKKTRKERRLEADHGRSGTSGEGSPGYEGVFISLGIFVLLILLGSWGKSVGTASLPTLTPAVQPPTVDNLKVPLAPPKIGQGANETYKLQKNLEALGCDPGPVDGRLGKRTISGIRRFMDANIQFGGDGTTLVTQVLDYMETGASRPCSVRISEKQVVRLSNGWYKKFEDGYWFKCKENAFLGATYCSRSSPP